MGVKKKFIIHAHFYQPPRHNPYTGEVLEETQTFYSSYNQIITDKCYGPLALARVKHTEEFFSTYSFLSFNFSPTLLKYIEERYPKLYISIINSDKISEKIFGYPSAIAQVYNNTIMPQLTFSEKKLYIKWGIESFKRTFQREPQGMWLGKSMCDEEMLEILIDCGIKFTILGDNQIKEAWEINNPKVRTERIKSGMYLWRSKQNPNKKLVIFVYNSELSKYYFKEISNTEKILMRVKNAVVENPFSIVATEGEIYGHHIKGGDEYLIRFIEKLKATKNIELTNLSTLFHISQPEYEVEIKHNILQSCYGINRKIDESGLRTDQSAVYQKLKQTLKKASELTREISHKIYFSKAIGILSEPSSAIENYITIYENPQPHQIMIFLEKNSINTINHAKAAEVLKPMKMLVSASFTSTSYTLFPEDISVDEAKNNIRNILYVLKTAKEYDKNIKTEDIVNMLKKEKLECVKDLKDVIEKLLEEETSLIKYACEKAYLYHLGFHINFIPSNLRIKIHALSQLEYHLTLTDIHTFETKNFQLKITQEKGVIFIRIKEEKDEKEKIFTINDFSSQTKKLITILTSDKPQDQDIKKFLYLLSNSNLPAKVISSYINLLNNNLAHTLPFAYEIALEIITLAKSYSNLTQLKTAIRKTPMASLMWKILLYMEKL